MIGRPTLPTASVRSPSALSMEASIKVVVVLPEELGPATITISIGLVLVPPEGSEERKVSFLERYLDFADNALYAAKRAGRNRVSLNSDCPA